MQSPKTHIIPLLAGLALTAALLACQPPANFVSGNDRRPASLIAQPTYNSASGELTLKITLPFEPEFRTQAIQCNQITSFRVTVSGLGLVTPALPTSPTPDANGRISGSNCEVFASFSNLPSGPGRIISIEGYDSAGNPVNGARIKGLVDLTPLPPNPSPSPNGPTTATEVSLRTTPAAEVVEHLLSSHGTKGKQVISKLSSSGLKTFIDSITGVTLQSSSPLIYNYTLHPLLIRSQQIAADLVTADGQLAQLSATNSSYRLPSGTVSGNVLGIGVGDQLEIRMHDPISQKLNITAVGSSEPFSLSGIAPGNWLLEVKNITSGETRTQMVSSSSSDISLNFIQTPTANWAELQGPLGGSVHALSRQGGTPEIAYAATTHGLYKSANANAGNSMSWTLAGLPQREWLSVFVKDATTIYAGSRADGIYKSTDSGSTWLAVVDADLTGKSVYRLVLAGGNLYAATSGGVLMQGPGPGFDWAPAGAQPPSSEEVRDLVFNGSQLLAALPTGGNAGVYAASVPVTGWSNVSQNLSVAGVGPRSVSGTGTSNRVVGGTDGSSYGCNLTLSPSCWGTASVVGTGAIQQIRYLSGPDRFVASSLGSDLRVSVPDGSFGLPTTWTPISDTPINSPFVLGFESDALSGSTVLGLMALTDGGGVSELVDMAGKPGWEPRNQGLVASTIRDLANVAGGGLVFAATEGGGVWRHDGNSWTPLLDAPAQEGSERYVQALAIDGSNTLYAAAKGRVYMLSEATGNTSWQLYNNGLPTSAEIVDLYAANDYIYAAVKNGSDQGLYRSCGHNSSGCASSNWERTESSFPVYSIAINPNNPAVMFIGLENGHIKKSTDSGATWTDMGEIFSGKSVGKLATGVRDMEVPFLFAVSQGAGSEIKVYDMINQTWSAGSVGPSLGADEIVSLAVKSDNPNWVAVGTRGNGVYHSFDALQAARAWTPFNTGSTSVGVSSLPVSSLLYTSNELYLGTEGRGVYRNNVGGGRN